MLLSYHRCHSAPKDCTLAMLATKLKTVASSAEMGSTCIKGIASPPVLLPNLHQKVPATLIELAHPYSALFFLQAGIIFLSSRMELDLSPAVARYWIEARQHTRANYELCCPTMNPLPH
jgi:hypothetical protein